MKHLPYFFLLGLFGLVLAAPVQAQKAQLDAEVIHWDQVDAWLQADNDTLYVINFWATWCRPCVAEMPHFEELQAEMAEDKVKVLFVSLDFVEEMDDRVRPFLKKKKLKSSVYLLDEPKYNTWIDKVSEEWSGAIPATVFVRHSAGVRVFHEGDFTYEELHSKVKSLIQ